MVLVFVAGRPSSPPAGGQVGLAWARHPTLMSITVRRARLDLLRRPCALVGGVVPSAPHTDVKAELNLGTGARVRRGVVESSTAPAGQSRGFSSSSLALASPAQVQCGRTRACGARRRGGERGGSVIWVRLLTASSDGVSCVGSPAPTARLGVLDQSLLRVPRPDEPTGSAPIARTGSGEYGMSAALHCFLFS